MSESTADRVSLELLDKFDALKERFGSVNQLVNATRPPHRVHYKTILTLEDKLINADLNIYLGVLANMGRPAGLLPVVLRRDGKVAYFGDENVGPDNYQSYIQEFLVYETKNLSNRVIVTELFQETGVHIAQPVLHLYRIGETLPRVLRLEALSRFFGYSPEYLVDPATTHK